MTLRPALLLPILLSCAPGDCPEEYGRANDGVCYPLATDPGDTAADTDTDTDSDTDTDPGSFTTLEGTFTVTTVPSASGICRVLAWSGTNPGTDISFGNAEIPCPTASGTPVSFSVPLDLGGHTEAYVQGVVDDGSILEAWAVANPYTVSGTSITGIEIVLP